MKITLDTECQYSVSFQEGMCVFRSLEARQGFREYTGFFWTPERRWKEVGGEEYSEEFGESDVFERK